LNFNPLQFQFSIGDITCVGDVVYFLWRYPDLIPALTTYPEVFRKLEGGADLMLPGVIISDDHSSTAGLGVFGKGQGCAIKLCGNR